MRENIFHGIAINRYNPLEMKAGRTILTARILVALFPLLIPGTLLPACTPASTLTPTPLETQPSASEEAVYRTVFEELYGTPRMYVLAEETSPAMDGVEGLDAVLESILPGMIGVEEQTADNFRLRNQQGVPVRPDMDLGLPYVLLTDDEFDEIFNINSSGWDIFYTRFPNSPGISTVSQVGFNEQLTQALVYVGTLSHWKAGVGFYLLLEKVEDTWQVAQQVMAWIY